jgi:2Fe-2S ferredoxin
MRVVVTDRDGTVREIEAEAGRSLMLALVEADLDVEATCGGVCSCATCHVHVDPAWGSALPSAQEDELALVEGSAHHAPGSRLACQISMEPTLDGLAVTIAPREY